MEAKSSRGILRGGAAFALVLLLALTACRRDEAQVPELQRTAVDARPQVEGFALISAGHGRQDGQPAIQLEFSRALAAGQDFDALLSVQGPGGEAVRGSWVLDEGAKILRFPFVEPGRDYRVKLRAGLAAADGSTLGADLERSVNTGPVEPAVAFASQGSVLPARDTRGLPVVSVNVPEVDVEFLRVRERELANFFGSYQRGGARSGWDLSEARWMDRAAINRLADSVYLNRFVLGGGENERRLSFLPVQNIPELQEPGVYFALMRRVGDYEGTFETAIFFVSDLGLHLRAYGDRVLVHTASLRSGEPIGDVALEILGRKGETVLKASTDGAGNALIAYTLDASHALVARSGNDVSVLPFNQPALDLSEFAVAGRPQAWFDVFAWSGRDLYRPGETLRLAALMRDHDGRAVPPQPLYLSLRQPDGKVYLETRLDPGEGGYLEWSHALPPEVPTGRWRVEFRTAPGAGEVVQGMSLRVEEFLPERMKLELDSPQPGLMPGQALELRVRAAYLYGAPAAGNRFSAKLAVLHEAHPVQALPDHHFGDPTLALPRDARDVLDEALDERGELARDLALPEEAAASGAPLAAVLTGSVYESGGRPVSRSLKRVVWPAAHLVGVRPLFDLKEGAPANGVAGFELVRSDAAGALSAAEVEVRLVRELRDYHWLRTDAGWSFDYTARYQTVDTRPLRLRSDGGERVDFRVEWGEYRLEVTDPATGLVTRLPFVAGWSWDNQNRGLDARPDKVKLALDKTAYRAGDTLKVTVTPPQPGPGFLVVESDRPLHLQPLLAKSGETYEIPVTAEWERHDVYVTAVVLRGGSALEKTTPARAVGVAHVPMDRTDRRIAVEIEAPAQARPEQTLPVTVSAPALAGRTAWATVSAVDLGIVNITRFPVPDAAGHFFAQRRLGVEARDLYGRVIESYEGESARLRFGGDMALPPLPQARRPTARVQTVDLFTGPVRLDAGGRATVEVPVPDFNGTLRVSALVFGEDSYGQASRESVLRAPLLAELSAPRALAPGDRSTVTVDLQNFTGAAGEFTVRLEAGGPLSVAEGRRRLHLEPEGRQTLQFALGAGEGAGIGTLVLSAEGGGHAVRRKFEVPVRPAWGAVARSQARSLAPGEPLVFGSEAAAGLLPGTVSARLSVTADPPLPLARALQDLLDYPYGCVEQTTTRGYAALLLDEANARRLGFPGLDEGERRRRLEAAFSRLQALQVGNGHFSFWGGSETVPVLTPHVAEFLLSAREAGFAVPEGLLQKSLERLGEDLLTGGLPFYAYDHPEHLRLAYQAHAGYVLARLNRAPLGTLRALHDNERGKALTGLPLVHLGLALALQGDEARAAVAIREGLAKVSERPRWLGDYGSELRDEAMMLALLREHGRGTPEQEQRLLALSRELQARTDRPYWFSTQERLALARLGRSLVLDGERSFSGTLTVGGETLELPPDRIFGRDFSSEQLAAGVRFLARAEVPVFAVLDLAGVPRAAPPADDSKVSVVRRWYRPDGKPWQPGPLREGEVLVVALRVEARENMPDALVEDLLPAGLELENLNLADPAQWAEVSIDGVRLAERGNAAELQHEEYRDDRYVAALRLYAGQPAHLFYLVRAVTPGSYQVPPPRVEDMYRPELRGVGRAVPGTITVTPP
ncbi:alpha-2-macroglobulin family protein [Arenimonas fontis]|uniref:Alpha-2-macroglobulin n=1 Tax=Arenimonas fontis TaxID=2608255 RepID=A0A5B2ZDW3_9GAMM|nr:alpha-2-macroglobulin [Arenimonas fontis]KAA2286135.1 alpha-2-macroglobulin family protein [Arenimonas fontis]